jgi:(4S)-4-hydroxy-5-phosphonooxypentane-2,3-dione isomerase
MHIINLKITYGGRMQVVLVHVHVLPDKIEAFKNASLENAQKSILEPGVGRFDVIQNIEDPTRFILIEGYKTADAPRLHKETEHYRLWRNTVSDMMAEPRQGIKYVNLFPAGEDF